VPVAEWVLHPDDNVDLCALVIRDVFAAFQKHAFFKAITSNLIPSQEQLEELGAVEDILLMIGYPSGLWDKVNNYPLMRRGITASHPAVDHEVDGVPMTVIDIASFPGSSGSPVFVYNHGTFANKKGDIVVGRRLLLLGVLASGPVLLEDGKIVTRNIPTAAVAVPQMPVRLNLGYIVKSSELQPLGKAVLKKLGL
jgi:hypothetical protein